MQEGVDELGQAADRHEKHARLIAVEGRHIGNCLLLAHASAEDDAVGNAAVCDRYVGGKGASQSRGNAGDHLGIDPQAAELEYLLPAAPKHVRVSNLEPHHVSPGQHSLSAPAVDLLLRLE